MKPLTDRLSMLGLAVLLLSGQSTSSGKPMIEQKPFGVLSDGREVSIFTLVNSTGMKASIINLGAALVSLSVPDKNGRFEDVVLGYDDLAGYVNDQSSQGATVGRYANRIGKASFSIDGQRYVLPKNSGENHLHGVFGKMLWSAAPVQTDSSQSVTMTYVSPDGEEGFPGTVTAKVTYTLNDKNELVIHYTAVTDRPTVFNPTNHAYFNLSGDFTKPILDHVVEIAADSFTPVDAGLIPSGEIATVAGTPLDFRKPTRLGARIEDPIEQMRFGGGYDHNWVLNGFDGSLRHVASVYEPGSGRYMEVLTDQPGIQLYTGNFLDGSVKGKKNIAFGKRTAVCLETQHFPDSPNKPNFPSVTLRPGEQFRSTTIYRFSIH